MSSCATPGQTRRVFKDAGRVCPVDYRIAPQAFAGKPQHHCDVLYVVGGLYGNPFALEEVERLIAQEQGEVLAVFNGDMHWFDKTADNFEALEQRAAKHLLLVGNVEAELRRQTDVGVGCGCAYPDCTPDDAVSRSNRIHRALSEAIETRPALKELMYERPATTTVGVAGKKVAITHGDEQLIGGWSCSRESLQEVLRQDELDQWMVANDVDVLATTHTCAPAALSLSRGVVINNGAAGLPNFAGQHFGLVVRVATTPHADALFGTQVDGVFVEAVPLRYNHEAYVAWFDDLWPAHSPAAISYRARIIEGADDQLKHSLLGGFQPGPAAQTTKQDDTTARATIDDVRAQLAALTYFEDMVDDTSCLIADDDPATIQLNITTRCNLACEHCHVNSSPYRTEAASRDVLEAVLCVAKRPSITTLDITGGAPELHSDLPWFLEQAVNVVDRVMVRTNLVILESPVFAPLLDLYAKLGVEVVASLPNVFAAQAESQRGADSFSPSLNMLRELNARGYGRDGKHILDLAFNPQWPVLPPQQDQLEAMYHRRLEQLGIQFDNLFAVANVPIGRYGAQLIDEGTFDEYLDVLMDSFNQEACPDLMCRHQISVGWDGTLYDCDFNQALELPVQGSEGEGSRTIFEYAEQPSLSLARPIRFRNHCYACTAGFGSSCGGTLVKI